MADVTCSIAGCEAGPFGHGWCNKHYSRWRRHGDPNHIGRIVYGPAEERFLSKVDVQPDGCWHWSAAVNADGYGIFSGESGPDLAHRWSYKHHVGPVPDGHELDHLCHNRSDGCAGGVTCRHRRCVNSAHLEPVTTAENVARAPAHFGARTHCLQGHPYNEQNTLTRPDGGRRCRECKNRRGRDYMRRKRAADRKERK